MDSSSLFDDDAASVGRIERRLPAYMRGVHGAEMAVEQCKALVARCAVADADLDALEDEWAALFELHQPRSRHLASLILRCSTDQQLLGELQDSPVAYEAAMMFAYVREETLRTHRALRDRADEYHAAMNEARRAVATAHERAAGFGRPKSGKTPAAGTRWIAGGKGGPNRRRMATLAVTRAAQPGKDASIPLSVDDLRRENRILIRQMLGEREADAEAAAGAPLPTSDPLHASASSTASSAAPARVPAAAHGTRRPARQRGIWSFGEDPYDDDDRIDLATQTDRRSESLWLLDHLPRVPVVIANAVKQPAVRRHSRPSERGLLENPVAAHPIRQDMTDTYFVRANSETTRRLLADGARLRYQLQHLAQEIGPAHPYPL